MTIETRTDLPNSDIPDAEIDRLVSMRAERGPQAWFAARQKWREIAAEYGEESVLRAVLMREYPVVHHTADWTGRVDRPVRKGHLVWSDRAGGLLEVREARAGGIVGLRNPPEDPQACGYVEGFSDG